MKFKDKDIHTKKSIKNLIIGRGSKKENYKPDYVCFVRKEPKLVIDAKNPKENVDKYIYQTSGYSLCLNQKFPTKNPVKYFILTNGLILKLFEWDKGKPILILDFSEFHEDNDKFKDLIEIISYQSLKQNAKESGQEFEFIKPQKSDLNGIFQACHNLIWKKEKIKPTEAFFEFSKIFFVKLYYDREIHNIIRKGETPKIDNFTFSVRWIEQQEEWEKNPFNVILFKNLRDSMEKEIGKKKKKRIFEKDEQILLKPSTIKEVTRLVEHYDLFGVDEDLNGRMFETFLSATVRGKDLGQFFTPRSVVKFMVQLADIKVTRNHIDTILDGLCGSGGFLIESMAIMNEKITNNKTLTNLEIDKLKLKVVSECLWGIDANISISRVARMNMYLHGDGSNRIFWLPDFLDKNMDIEQGIVEELKEEANEFKDIINGGFKFDIVLTNPPFSMKYESSQPDEKKILEEYEIAYADSKNESSKLKASLKSNVLSIERYSELLKPQGKLITIIDESVLNADSEKDYRDFIRKYFIIKAVISLPRNTFVNADTTVKTSILYLVKKENEKEKQPSIFMAIVNNVGHNDTGKPCPELNELPEILNEYRKFENE